MIEGKKVKGARVISPTYDLTKVAEQSKNKKLIKRSNSSATQQNKKLSLNVNVNKLAPLTSFLIEQLYTNTTLRTQRLDKKNISELFLVQTRKPIKLPTLEVLELPELPVLNIKQEALAKVVKFKAAKKIAKEKVKLYLAYRKKYLKRLVRHKNKLARNSQNTSKYNRGELRLVKSTFNTYGNSTVNWRSAHTLARKATLVQNQSKANFTNRSSAIKSKVNN